MGGGRGEGQKRGDLMCCGSSVGELVEAGQFFLNKLQKAKITFPFLFGVLYRTNFLTVVMS